jgi:hypothetical protein
MAALRGNGSPQDVRLFVGGCALHDTHRGRVGGFAGPVALDDRVGSFANRPGERRRGCGSFAGDPDGQRRGCFADTDRVVVVTQRDGVERSRVTGELGLGRLLRRARRGDEVAVGGIDELRTWYTVVVVDRAVVASADRPRPVRARAGGSVRAGRQRAAAVTCENVGEACGAGMLVADYRADPGATPAGHRGRGAGLVGGGDTPGLADEPGTGTGR